MEQLTKDRIERMDDAEIIDNVVSLFDYTDPVKRAQMTAFMEVRAKRLGIQTEFRRLLKAHNETDKTLAREYTQEHSERGGPELQYDSKNNVAETIDNYMSVLRWDDRFRTFRFNAFTGNAEYTEHMQKKLWTDTEDSESIAYIQKAYGFYHEPMFKHAMRAFQKERSYHPVRDYLDAITWDGVQRIENFMTKWMGCDDSDYYRELSRLIFAGGIHRLYEPGCKFDDVVVLVGQQGQGKSTIVRWLAIKDDWYGELNDLDGQRGIETLQGSWICEISELLALARARETEAVKSYITRLSDKYRVPWDKRPSVMPRQCIFIGTTNKERFLSDKTGNRRWFPARVSFSGRTLFEREQECRAYIVQCWAEAKARYSEPFMKPVERPELLETIKQQQHLAEEDDWREGMIEAYLQAKRAPAKVCTLELWRDALKMGELIRPSLVESTSISLIMQKHAAWKRMDKPAHFPDYGTQRGWELLEDEQEEVPF